MRHNVLDSAGSQGQSGSTEGLRGVAAVGVFGAGVAFLVQEAVCGLLSDLPSVGTFLVDSQQGCSTVRFEKAIYYLYDGTGRKAIYIVM